jgi:hypothetical protein
MVNNPLWQAARRAARRGWAVLPCHHPTPTGCSCRQPDCASPAKHPRTHRGVHDATTDPDLIDRWWRRWPQANLAIRTGAASGLVVIDIDPDRGGLDTIRRLASQAPIPPGRRARTGSGGWHLYFAHPGPPVRNTAGTALGAGVDVRGDGGYVIAPPSRHATGTTYTWTGTTQLPALPDHLAARLQPPHRHDPPPQPVRVDRTLSAWAARALDDEATQVRASPAGTRNHRLNRAAFNLGQIASTGLLDTDLITWRLHHAAIAAGLGHTEAARTIRSGLQAGLRHPRTPTGRGPAPSHPPPEPGVGLG